MVAVKAGQAEAFLRSPGPDVVAFLFYGTDPGLVTERSLATAHKLAARDTPPGEILRIDDDALADDPDRLAVELQMVAMFGGRKVVRAVAGRRLDGKLLKSLLDERPPEAYLVVEAGNLTPSAELRTLFEKSSFGAAIPCYADESRDLSALIQDVVAAHKLKIEPAARDLLVSRLGADRALSRNEIEKLCLYALRDGTITESHVEDIVGDASELTLDRTVYAIASGRIGDALSESARAEAAGESPQALLAAIERHFIKLHRVSATVEKGQSAETAMRALRPPIHFKQQSAFAQQVRQWRPSSLDRALGLIETAARKARLGGDLEAAIVQRLLLDLYSVQRAAK